MSTAQKNGVLRTEHAQLAPESMMRLNRIGRELAGIEAVTAMTDVTGFGLAGHLLELCRGSGLHATIEVAALPLIESVADYIAAGQLPGGTGRNVASYGAELGEMSEFTRTVICDPQTSGGLLVAVRPEAADQVARLLAEVGLYAEPIGEMRAEGDGPRVTVDETAAR